MPEQRRQHDDVRGYLDRLPAPLRHPFAAGFLAVAMGAVVFWLGISVGRTTYRAFAGDDGSARFGLVFAVALVAIAAITAWLGRHRRTHDDERALTAVREVHRVLELPFAVGLLAVAAAALLFWLGIGVGETLYAAFDGNAAAAAAFGAGLVVVSGAFVVIGTRLDRRRQARADDGAATDLPR